MKNKDISDAIRFGYPFWISTTVSFLVIYYLLGRALFGEIGGLVGTLMSAMLVGFFSFLIGLLGQALWKLFEYSKRR